MHCLKNKSKKHLVQDRENLEFFIYVLHEKQRSGWIFFHLLNKKQLVGWEISCLVET